MRTSFVLMALLALAGCLPQAKTQSCGSGSVFNSTARACVPITAAGAASGVSITASSPLTPTVTVSQTQTTATQFSITVNDRDNQGYQTRWMLYPPSGVSFAGNPLSQNTASLNLIPNNLALQTGLWTLSAEVLNANATSIVASKQWAVNVTSQPTPTLSINAGSGLTGLTGNRLTTDVATLNLSVNVSDTVGNTSWRLRWYYDGAVMSAVGPFAGTVNGMAQTFFSTVNALSTDNPPLSAGPHVIRAELRNSADTSVYSSLEWTIFVYAPNLPQVSTTAAPIPDTSVTVSAVNGVTIAAGGYSSNGTVLTTADAFCVAVNDFNGTLDAAGGVTVQFKKNGANTGVPQSFTANHGRVCLNSANPTYTMTLANPAVGEFQTVSAAITDVGTNTVVATVNWGVSVRPKNTAPLANIDAPATPSNHSQGALVSYSLTATDEDTTSTDDMGVYFFYDGVALDGVNFFPGTSITSPDCTHPAGAGPAGAARITCDLTLPAYNLTGRIDPATANYTLTAYVADEVTFGGAPQNSNTISWTIQPVLSNSESVIAPQGVTTSTPSTGTAAAAAGNSYIALLTSPTTPTVGPVSEGTSIVFNVLVKDDDRDDFTIQIDRCVDAGCTVTQNVVASTTVARSTDSLGRRAPYSYTLAEDLVSGMVSDVITFRVTTRDELPDGSQGVAQTMDMTLTVNDYNPFPLWAGSGSASPALGDVVSVVAGMPLTLDPGSITDASTTDGSTIVYQWEISTDAGVTWSSITGATSRVLKWTPGNDLGGTAVRLRLCLGDDGFGNEITLCTGIANPGAPAMPATTRVAGPWTGVTARANSLAKDAANPDHSGDVASWFDPSDRAWYMAYVNKNGTDDGTIVVEKHSMAANGTLSLAKTVSFRTEESGTFYDAQSLGLVGQSVTVGAKTYKGLYLSYVTQSAPSIAPRLRVRHLDITDGDMLFSYSGFTESDATTTNMSATTSSTAGEVTLEVLDPAFDAGEYITLNGIPLTSVATTATPGDCEFEADNTLTADQVMTNIFNAYATCVAATSDARDFAPNGAVVADEWAITNFPRDWVDLGYSLYLGKVGTPMVQDGYLLLPFLDNLNTGKLSVAVIDTVGGGLASGALGSTAGSYSQIPSYVAVNTTVQGLDLSNSHNDTANFDVAMVTTASGLNVYRLTFTAPSTIAVTGSVTNVFGAGEFIRKPRIASGPAGTNNHVFVVAEDTSSLTRELFFARVDASTYTLAAGMPVIPLDAAHEQASELTEFRISALSGSKRAALGVLTDAGEVLVSLLKPVNPSPDIPSIRPVTGAGVSYPKVDDSVTMTVPVLAMSEAGTLTVGDPGATAGENAKEGVVLVHSSSAATDLSATFVNVTEESISATAVSGTGLFQPPYVK